MLDVLVVMAVRACGHLRLVCRRQPHGLDDCIYGPLWGLSGKEAYWANASARPLLSRIRRRTLIVHAEDDPICPVGAMPLDVMASNPAILTALTRHGGHMGYTAGLSPLTHTWTDRLLVHFLRHFERRRTTHANADGGATTVPPPVPTVARPSRL